MVSLVTLGPGLGLLAVTGSWAIWHVVERRQVARL
jgi:hypothetical protein